MYSRPGKDLPDVASATSPLKMAAGAGITAKALQSSTSPRFIPFKNPAILTAVNIDLLKS
jgi:hypothetical protein